MSTINAERLAQVTRLSKGAHVPNDQEMCAMEAVAYVAGEPWSDHPKCSCPVLTAFTIMWGDSLSDEDRTRLLLPMVPRLVGTRGSEAIETRRATMAADWFVRVHTPAWLRLAGLDAEADALSSFPEITNSEKTPIMAPLKAAETAASAAWSAAESAAGSAAESAARSAAWSAAWRAAKSAAKSAAESAARSAAWSAAESAAESAAWSAAWSAAESAAESAAWSAAWSAARSAAESAAESAARSAAESAARSAAESALDATRLELQASALDLLERMIAMPPRSAEAGSRRAGSSSLSAVAGS